MTLGRREEERGSVAVELAVLLPVLLALVFGVIDFGMLMNDAASVRQGVREGARQAVVGNFGSSCSGTDVQKVVCMTKADIGNTQGAISAAVRLQSGDSVATAGHNLLVCAAVPMKSASGVFAPILSGKYITSKVAMRVEQTSTLAQGGDSDPTGRNWSWCT